MSEEWTENGVQHLIVYSYDASGYPISMTYRKSTDAATAAEVYFLASNPQGDIIYIYDIDGNRVVTYNYDAWGNILSITGTKATTIGRYNPFRYRGYYYDNETGLYYLNSRYYDPSSGRFLNADVYINGNGDIIGFNLFAYCGNNPVMGYDPDGTFNWSGLKNLGNCFVKAAIITACVGGAVLTLAAAITMTISSGGAGAIAVPAAIAIAANCIATATAVVAAAGATAVVVGGIGENISYSHDSKGGNAYRGGSTYNKDGTRVDYESYSNGNGNAHLHNKSLTNGKEKIYTLQDGIERYHEISNVAKNIIKNSEVKKGIIKAIKYIVDFSK